jgi:hypothetical protein
MALLHLGDVRQGIAHFFKNLLGFFGQGNFYSCNF